MRLTEADLETRVADEHRAARDMALAREEFHIDVQLAARLIATMPHLRAAVLSDRGGDVADWLRGLTAYVEAGETRRAEIRAAVEEPERLGELVAAKAAG